MPVLYVIFINDLEFVYGYWIEFCGNYDYTQVPCNIKNHE